MPRKKVKVTSNRKGWGEVMQSNALSRFVKEQADRINDRARDIFLEQVKHNPIEHFITFPPYANSFNIQPGWRSDYGAQVWISGNSDPISNIVEWGADIHPGIQWGGPGAWFSREDVWRKYGWDWGKTVKVLRYRPLGRAVEQLHSEHAARGYPATRLWD